MKEDKEYLENPKRMRSHIVATGIVRNPRLERRIMEENRERMMYYMLLAGTVLVSYALL